MKNSRSVFAVVLCMLGVCLMMLPDGASAFQEKFQKRYDIGGGLVMNHTFEARETYDGGIITAFIKITGTCLSSLYVMKTDSCGTPNLQLSYDLNANPNEYFYHSPVFIREVVGVGYIIAGTAIIDGNGCSAVYLMKIDYSGIPLWTGVSIKRFGTGLT